MRYASTSIEDSLIGSTLAGRYLIEARVGSGAMGAVYRAQQAGLSRPVAIKILNRDRSLAGDTVQRFRREAQAMSALHHPNTVRVFDFGSTDEGLLYLAMELLEGESVTQRLQRGGALHVKEAVQLAQAVLRSVGEAHAHGIIHRDLKPDNIFLARVQGEPLPVVKVLDFGIAKAVEGERKIDQFETLDGTVFGTPRYMSPEQAAGKPLDHRSDLYAVGIMLFEYLAGRPPFVDSDAVVVMARHIREAPAPLSAAAPDAPIPPCLEAVVERALAKDPALRWQSAEEFERALARCLPDVERLQRLALRGWHKSWIAQLVLTKPRRRFAWSLAAAAACLSVGTAVALPNLFGEPEPLTEAAHSGEVQLARASSADAARASSNTADGSVFAQAAPKRVVTLETTPESAQVYRNGVEVGETPLDIAVTAGSPILLLLRKRGFVDHTIELVPEDGRKNVTLLPMAQPRATQSRATQAKATPSRRERRQKQRAQPAPSISARSPQVPAVTQSSPYEKF
ncbi:MAG TPA: serine/threonine-protein kinase [Polyangiales bacterium]|nr:serine/threonine-protein kinase [Polyangiales bacterium]